MILRILLLFVFIIIIQVDAATVVGGILIQNTVWTADASENPYTLMRDVQIPFNSTLTIQPGVIIDFSTGDFEILVKGFLRADGTSEKVITFQGGSGSDTKWMLKFQSTQLSHNSISYAHFMGPKKALQLIDVQDGIQENNGTLLIQSSTFSNNATIGANGVYPRPSTPSVPALQFQSCTFNKTTILSANVNSEPVTINNSQIYDTTFYPQAANEGIQINDCNLTNVIIHYLNTASSNFVQLYKSNVKGISLVFGNTQISYQFIVRQSMIENLVVSQYSGDVSWSYPTNVTFEDSTLSNILLSSLYYGYPWYTHGYVLIIHNSLFSNGTLDFMNTATLTTVTIKSSQLHNVNIIQRNTATSYDENRKLVIRNSTFVDGSIIFECGQSEISYSTITLAITPLSLNGNSLITCSSITRSSSIPQQDTVGISAVGLTISQSTIKDFAVAIQTYPTYTYKINITDSNFIGNSVYNIENKAIYDVSTQHIYWGTDSGDTILNKISDYWDDINYGFVSSSDYSSNILTAEASCPPYTENENIEVTPSPIT